MKNIDQKTTQSSGILKSGAIVVSAAFVWFLLYSNLEWFATFSLQFTGITKASRFGDAFYFFIYEVPKVLLLLTGVVFVMGIVHTFVSPERTRAMLSGRRTGVGNVMAATLGIVTPFCSCSAVPLFIGFLQAGVPLGVTFSFLISSPMINEVALALLFGMFGWKVALLYMGMGLMIAIFSGLVIGKLRMERYLEDWVQKLQENKVSASDDCEVMSWALRLREGGSHVREIVGKVWLYIVLGVGLGARYPWLCPRKLYGFADGEKCLVVSPCCRVDRGSDVLECCRYSSDCSGSARQRCRTRHSDGLYDERHRTLCTRNDYPAQSA